MSLPGTESLSPSPPFDDRPLSPRMRMVLGVERVALVLRYVVYLLLIAYYVWGARPEALPNLVLITVGAIVQNTFVHWVLHRREYEWFLSPVNFFIYLGKVGVLVAVTGGGESDAALLYLAVIVGYCLYSPRFHGTFRVTLAACIGYTLTLLVYWMFEGVDINQSPIVTHFAAIISCGWLMGLLGRMMRGIELEAMNRAAALASSEATLRAILDSTPSPIIVYEENEFISDVNDRACEFLGSSRESLLGKRFRSFLFDDGTLPNKLASLRTKGEYFGEVLVVSDEGTEHSVHLVARSFVRDGQRLFVALMHDITEQKNLQEAQRLATMQLEQVNRELQRVHDLRAAFFATVSRRLRSPLSAILGHMEMLLSGESGPLTPEQSKALQSSRRSATRVFDLLDEAFEVEGVRPREPERRPGAVGTPRGGGV